MNNYIDKYGRYHDKPVPSSGEPSSNNGWIYTAYADKAGLPVDFIKINSCYDDCLFLQKDKITWGINRSPRKSTPPISRDEILGMAGLNQLAPFHLQGWNFSPFPISKFSLTQLVKQLWQVRKQHRNYFWQNNLDQLYRFAFSVPFADRAFILKKWGKFQWFNPVHQFYAAWGKLNSLYKPNAIDWLKYGGKGVNALSQEFPEDHPVRKKLGL